MKSTLGNLIEEKSIGNSHSTLSLILTVLLKYGMAPLACIYLGYIVLQKDIAIQKNSDTLVKIVQEQTVATTRNNEIQTQLIKVIEGNTSKLSEIQTEQKLKNRTP